MSDATLAGSIVIESVETKAGTSAAGKPWQLFRVKAQGGSAYSTFDSALGNTALASTGKQCAITYKVGERGNDLVTLIVGGEAPPEPVRDHTENGAPDWDMIGLRKTRCALWVAAIQAGLGAPGAKQMVIEAELDIFRRKPAEPGDEVPF